MRFQIPNLTISLKGFCIHLLYQIVWDSDKKIIIVQCDQVFTTIFFGFWIHVFSTCEKNTINATDSSYYKHKNIKALIKAK